MKVLLKSFKELEEEYGVQRFMYSYIILSHVVYPEMINLLGKIVEAEYDKMSDSYIINAWYYDPKFIKGVVNWYNIKDLSDGKEYTLSFQFFPQLNLKIFLLTLLCKYVILYTQIERRDYLWTSQKKLNGQ